MKSTKSTLESFKENELTRQNKLHVYGGLTDGGNTPLPGNEFEDESEVDENGDPVGNAGPRGTGSNNSAGAVSTLGNNNTGSTNPLGK